MSGKSTRKARRKLRWFPWLIGIFVAILLGFGIWRLWQTGFLALFSNPDALQAYISGFGPRAPIIFFVMQVIQVIVSMIPGNVTTIVGGALFGFWPGFLLSFGAIILGSVLAFGLARALGVKAVKRIVGTATFEKYQHLVDKDSTKARTRFALILMMLMPYFPDDLICFLAGLTSLPFGNFLSIIVLARPWGILFSALIGSGGLYLPLWAMILLGLLSVTVGILGLRYAPQLEVAVQKMLKKILDAVSSKKR